MDYGDNFSGRRGDGYGNESRVDRDRAYPESYSSFERREKERGHYDERGGSGGGRERQGDGRYGGSPSFNGDGGEHANGRARGAPSSAGGAAAVREPWKPSARVQNWTPEQVKEIRDRLNLTVEEPEGGDYGSIPSAVESFEDMNLHASVLKDIHDHGYNRPTPIQCQAIPVSLAGNDILGCAETGSGKTASFSIPMIQHVVLAREEGGGVGARGGGPSGLVLAPTRELAQQIQEEIRVFAKTSRLRSLIVVGGTPMSDQRASLRAGIDILVATPGRLIDHLSQENCSLRRTSYLVLDEADRMLDMGFEPQIKEIMSALPKTRQTMLFSATMPPEIEDLCQLYLTKPVTVKVGRVASPAANVTQQLEKVTENTKIDSMIACLMEDYTVAKRDGQTPPLTIIFVAMKNRCDEVVELLRTEDMHAVALHGGRSQAERESALSSFRSGRCPILVATDVASRGLDVSGVAHVINLDLPRALEEYVHRIGRTGRAGMSGRATSFYTDRDAFIVTKIKTAIAEAAAGNVHAFATGREARRKEREESAAFNQGLDSAMDSAQGIQVLDESMRGMLLSDSKPEGKDQGVADDAWDD